MTRLNPATAKKEEEEESLPMPKPISITSHALPQFVRVSTEFNFANKKKNEKKSFECPIKFSFLESCVCVGCWESGCRFLHFFCRLCQINGDGGGVGDVGGRGKRRSLLEKKVERAPN